MAHSSSAAPSIGGESSGVTMMDPRAARFGQTVTMTVLLVAIGFQEPLLILAIAVVLNAAVFSGWRLNLYGTVWRRVMIPLVGNPEETEAAAPHRFAKLMGASMSGVATILLFGGPAIGISEIAILGYGVALMHAGAAAAGGVADYCIGCRMYRQVGYFRRLGIL